jgi:hypothetical protein
MYSVEAKGFGRWVFVDIPTDVLGGQKGQEGIGGRVLWLAGIDKRAEGGRRRIV